MHSIVPSATLRMSDTTEFSAKEKLHFKKMFDQVDIDKSGAISIEEMAMLCKNLGVQLSEERLQNSLTQIDVDGNGELDFDEFLLWLKSAQNTGDDEFATLKAKVRLSERLGSLSHYIKPKAIKGPSPRPDKRANITTAGNSQAEYDKLKRKYVAQTQRIANMRSPNKSGVRMLPSLYGMTEDGVDADSQSLLDLAPALIPSPPQSTTKSGGSSAILPPSPMTSSRVRRPLMQQMADDNFDDGADPEVSSLLLKLRSNQARMHQKITYMKAEWARKPPKECRGEEEIICSPRQPTPPVLLSPTSTKEDVISPEATLTLSPGALNQSLGDASLLITSPFDKTMPPWNQSQVLSMMQSYTTIDMDNIGTISMQHVDEDWSQYRYGNVLNANCILRRDRGEEPPAVSASTSSRSNSRMGSCVNAPQPHAIKIGGCTLLRMVSKMNLAAVGQPSQTGIKSLLNELKHQGNKDIFWVNVREEATVYINNHCYTLCDSVAPWENVRQRLIPAKRLEQMEHRLRKEVIKEAQHYNGNVALHMSDPTCCFWEAVEETALSTMADLFKQKHPHIKYMRIPVGNHSPPTLLDIDAFLNITFQHPTSVIVFNCHSGRGRSTTALMVAALLRSFTHAGAYQPPSAEPSQKTSGGFSWLGTRFRALRRLLSLFPGGQEYMERIEVIGNICGGPVGQLREKVEQMLGSTNMSVYRRGLYLLERYGMFIALTAYLDERFGLPPKSTPISSPVKSPEPPGGAPSGFPSFSEWMKERQDVSHVLQDISSLAENSDALERVATPRAVDVESHVVVGRNGDVLKSHMVLRDILKNVGPWQVTSHLDPIEGVGCLRTAALRSNLYTAAAIDPIAVTRLTTFLKRFQPNDRVVNWVNIGIEPIIYIHKSPYALHDFLDGNDLLIRGVSSERLAAMEERLKADVVREIIENGGSFTVQSDSGPVRLQCSAEDVMTPKEMVSAASGARVHYVRQPTTPHNYLPSISELHQFIALVDSLQCTGDSSLVMVNRSGHGHSTMLLTIASLVKMRMVAPLSTCNTKSKVYARLTDTPPKTESEVQEIINSVGILQDERAPDNLDADPPQLIIASHLMQIIGSKTLHEVVDTVIALCGRGSAWNVLHAIRAFSALRLTLSDRKEKEQIMQVATLNVQRYFLILVIAAYLEENGCNMVPTLDQWIDTKPEIMSRYQHMSEHPEAALACIEYFAIPTNVRPPTKVSVVEPSDSRDKPQARSRPSSGRRRSVPQIKLSAPSIQLMEGKVHTRSGNILGPNMGIKADHFPGCQKKDILPPVPGAPNFRKVPFVNVYGCGMPTIGGIRNVLTILGGMEGTIDPSWEVLVPRHGVCNVRTPQRSPSSKATNIKAGPGYIVWVNLREEPVLWVNDRPFVLRDLSQPYVNVEITGIDGDNIERIETLLQADVMAEAAACEGNILVHDEGKPCELIGTWESVTASTVCTARNVYNDMKSKEGARVEFWRVCVTDEQAPELKDFDLIFTALQKWIGIASQFGSTQRVSFLFNCQMGRGRTTTGMVCCCMMLIQSHPEYYEILEEQSVLSLCPDSPKVRSPGKGLDRGPDYSLGEYKCIIALVRALSDGRRAKKITDVAINACDRMQNLRTAILSFKNSIESTDISEEGRARALHHGVHYLQRYLRLICFASYLEECVKPPDEQSQHGLEVSMTFEKWMEARPDLTLLHDTAALE